MGERAAVQADPARRHAYAQDLTTPGPNDTEAGEHGHGTGNYRGFQGIGPGRSSEIRFFSDTFGYPTGCWEKRGTMVKG